MTKKINKTLDEAKTCEKREITHHHFMITLTPKITGCSNSFLVNNGEDFHNCMYSGVERRMEKWEREKGNLDGFWGFWVLQGSNWCASFPILEKVGLFYNFTI